MEDEIQGSFIINRGSPPKEITEATSQEEQSTKKPRKSKNPNVLYRQKGLSIIKVNPKNNALIKKRGLSIIPLSGKKINKNFDDIFSGILHVHKVNLFF